MDKTLPHHGHTAICLLGPSLDRGLAKDRWSRWRPTVALCQNEDLLIRHMLLLHGPKDERLAQRIAEDIALVSPETEVEPVHFAPDDPWDFEEVFATLLDFSRSRSWDTDREAFLVHITTGTHVAQICLFLLTESRHFPARLVQTSPDPRRNGDPAGTYQLIDLDLSRYDSLATRAATERAEATSLLKSGIETRNADFNRQIDEIEQVALRSTAPILLMGPTGAGKSQLAARIADLRRVRHRLEGQFVEVNCATLRGDQASSALFGHEKGAFTGAAARRAGLLRSAHGGLLFLDEIGELGLDEQAMLLRALEEKRFLPVGADREVESDFQLIAGTNRDLGERVREGAFRDDLLARINLWTFRLPGLRERIEDVEPNLDYELERYSAATGRRVRFNKEAREQFLSFATAPTAAWLGNFRDLNASITRLATLADSGRITRPDVDREIERLRRDWQRGATGTSRSAVDEALESALDADSIARLDLFDRVQLAAVVRVCRESPSLSAAGRTLFAASRVQRRSTNDADRLRKYLARYGLEFRQL